MQILLSVENGNVTWEKGWKFPALRAVPEVSKMVAETWSWEIRTWESDSRITVFLLTKLWANRQWDERQTARWEREKSTDPHICSQQILPTTLCCNLSNISNTNIISQLPKALISSMDWPGDMLTGIKHSFNGEIHAEFWKAALQTSIVSKGLSIDLGTAYTRPTFWSSSLAHSYLQLWVGHYTRTAQHREESRSDLSFLKHDLSVSMITILVKLWC